MNNRFLYLNSSHFFAQSIFFGVIWRTRIGPIRYHRSTHFNNNFRIFFHAQRMISLEKLKWRLVSMRFTAPHNATVNTEFLHSYEMTKHHRNQRCHRITTGPNGWCDSSSQILEKKY